MAHFFEIQFSTLLLQNLIKSYTDKKKTEKIVSLTFFRLSAHSFLKKSLSQVRIFIKYYDTNIKYEPWKNYFLLKTEIMMTNAFFTLSQVHGSER